MRKIVNTQAELDGITRIEVGEEVIVKSALRLSTVIEVFGILRLEASLDCSFINNRYVEAWGNSSVVARENSSVVARENSSVEAWGNSSVEAWGNSSVVARENSSVEARGNSSVEAWGNSSVEARGNSSVEARGNSSVEAWGNSSVEAWGNSSVVAWGNSSVVAWGNSSVVARENSSVEAWGNSSVVAWENSSVEAWGNSSVEAWGNSLIRLSCKIKDLSLRGFSILSVPFDLKFKFKKEKTCVVQKYKPLQYLDREGITAVGKQVVLFKRVSKDFKTQENTQNETLWEVGSTMTHLAWEPDNAECGPSKFHACSRPYFCDDFRSEKDDKYIAIQVDKKDLYEWKNPTYPHKIAFRAGKVLYVCNKFGKKIE